MKNIIPRTVLREAGDYGLMALGCVLYAIGINGIVVPHQFLNGGVMGLALIGHYLLPHIPLTFWYLALNLPLFVAGRRYVGRRFFMASIIGTLMCTASIHWVHVPLPVHDQIISAIFAGIVMGAANGIILRGRGSTGGTDILGVIMLKKFSFRIGNTALVFNSLILAASACLFSLDAALYTLVFFYVNTQVLNLVVSGLSKRKAVLIISDKWEEIRAEILKSQQRGLTILDGRGAYHEEEKNVIYTIIHFHYLTELKRMTRAIDPEAFIVVSDTLEVVGQRMGNQQEW